MEKKVFKIKCLSNMHVGSGDINFNIIDNQVQRDVITELPTINSSGLKGAIREFCEEYELPKDDIEFIFGKNNEGKNNDNNNSGQYKFFNANLLSLPVRSNKKPFFRATTIEILNNFLEYNETFGENYSDKEKLKDLIKSIKNKMEKEKPLTFKKIDGEVVLEDYIAKQVEVKDISVLTELIGENIAIFDNDTFKDIAKNMPVIARNKLVNGKSENLWYEEIVPRESQFYFGIITSKIKQDFEKKLTSELVQIGANNSIGYGYTQISEIGGDK